MKKNNEIKWAVAIGVVMITICVIAFMVANRDKKEVENLDIQIYKLQKNGDDIKNYTYKECKLSTEDLVTVNREFNRIYKLEDKDKVTGAKILGEYKIVKDSLFVAFDITEDDDKVVYRSDTTSLYEFNSSLYQLLEEKCN